MAWFNLTRLTRSGLSCFLSRRFDQFQIGTRKTFSWEPGVSRGHRLYARRLEAVVICLMFWITRYLDMPSVSAQRKNFKLLEANSAKSTPLTLERAQRLMDAGFEWTAKNPRHLMWEVRFAELKDFKVGIDKALPPLRTVTNRGVCISPCILFLGGRLTTGMLRFPLAGRLVENLKMSYDDGLWWYA